MNTPWGKADGKRVYTRGIIAYSTPSHGGIHVSKTLNVQIPEPFRRADGWYEEDCEVCKVIFTFPQFFSQEMVDGAKKILKDYFPYAYEAVTGETIPLAESQKKRQDDFLARNNGRYIVISAVGDWHKNCPPGSVLVLATPNGERKLGFPQGKFFLVGAAEYRDKVNEGFVINTARHQEVSDGF